MTGGTALPANALTADGDGWAVSRRVDASQGGGTDGGAAPVGDVLDAVGEVTGGTVGGGTTTGGSTGTSPAAGWSVVSSAA